jgi:hypothetical protein
MAKTRLAPGRPLQGEVAMNIEVAKELNDMMLSICARMDGSVRLMRDSSDRNEFDSYRKTIGSIMGLVYTDILSPIYKQYPLLMPNELKQS